MKTNQIRKMIYAAVFLALALVLPFLTGQIPEIGSMLCPMHFPVLLCGFICGWPWGVAVGAIAPLLRSAIFGMPPMFPTATAMAFELAVYGGVAGLLYQLLPKKPVMTYVTLLVSMVLGRVVWGIVQLLLTGVTGKEFTWAMFMSGAVLKAVPGIIAQIVLIPVIVIAMKKAGLILNRKD